MSVKSDNAKKQKAENDLAPCKCGGNGVLWLEIVKATVNIYWVECDKCHKWTDKTFRKKTAILNWNDKQNGVIKSRNHHNFSIGF